jgi:hypothetical protein
MQKFDLNSIALYYLYLKIQKEEDKLKYPGFITISGIPPDFILKRIQKMKLNWSKILSTPEVEKATKFLDLSYRRSYNKDEYPI